MVKFLITFYLITSQAELFLSVYFINKWSNISRVWYKITAESQSRVFCKVLLIKKSLYPEQKNYSYKKHSTRKMNFQRER